MSEQNKHDSLGIRHTKFRNVDSVAMPSYCVMQIDGTEIKNGDTVWLVKRPAAPGGPGQPQRVFVFNLHVSVPPGGYGRATQDFPAMVLYDTANTPAIGETWGVRVNEQKLFKGDAGFQIVGAAENGACMVTRDAGSVQFARGTLQADLNPGSFANCLLTTGTTVQANAWVVKNPNKINNGDNVFLWNDGSAWWAIHDLGSGNPVDVVRATTNGILFRGGTQAGVVVFGTVLAAGAAITLNDFAQMADDGTNSASPRVPTGTPVIAVKFSDSTHYFILAVMDRQSGGQRIAFARMTTTLSQGGTATARIWSVAPDGTETNTGQDATVVDKFLPVGGVINNTSDVILMQVEGGCWIPVLVKTSDAFAKNFRVDLDGGSEYKFQKNLFRVNTYGTPADLGWSECIPIQTANMVIDERYDATTHKFQFQKVGTYVLKLSNATGWTDWHAAVPQVVVTDASVTTSDWIFAKDTVYVMEVTAAADKTIAGVAC